MTLRDSPKSLICRIKSWLAGLSFRTGVVVLLMAVPFYIISFAQFALPIGAGWKSALWVIFFGLAKSAQYGGLAILGVEGVRRLRERFGRRASRREE